MIIPVTLASAPTSFSSSANPKLPPGLVKLSNDEIVLVELQGLLEVDLNDPSERNGKLVGKLKMDEATNKPTLLIGHHLLEGKIAALPKPYAILVRAGGSANTTTTTSKTASTTSTVTAPRNGDRATRNGTADRTQMEEEGVELDEAEAAMAVDNESQRRHQDPEFAGDDDDGMALESSGSGASWKIAGIVKKKIIFSKRPMPVIKRK